VQGHGMHGMGETMHIPFPFDEAEQQGDFSRVNMGIHTALKILRNKVDLQHFCGYVTMLNPSSQHANRKLSDASDGRGETELASGSDLSNGSNSKIFDPRMSFLAFFFLSLVLSVVPTTELEWVPLELCFGIPLFSSELNQKVCKKIATHGLCRKESLQKLLHSSRKLSLQVLNFVHSFQEGISTLDQLHDAGSSSSLLQPISADMGVPLPAKNLLFKEGVLSEWNGWAPSSV
ncbi:F91A1 protein, partial [Urocynchramus pylzowi]|nr:F91A1 protein [Urocynchramus pylzowi]